MKPQARTQIGPYRLLAKIGEGGMGTVHLSKMDGPAGFNKLAVVKELRPELSGSPEFREMFLNEARLAARLTHPNVVHTYGANEDQGRMYLAIEYLDGQPWSRIRHALWERSALPFNLHVKVLAEALAGLHYAHELRDYDGKPLQVVHCDMSPQNVFVTYDGQVKVVDFGVARAVTAKERANSGMIVGKLGYIAPEQARGETVDRRADVFAVGVMLWEALAGRKFVESQDIKSVRRRRSAGDEPRVREVVPNVPPALSDICDRALALDPEERFATAVEFREALLGYLAEDVQDVDHSRLGALVSEAFSDERARVHAIIERHMKERSTITSSIEDLVSSLHPEPGEHTLRADLSELATVSRLRDDQMVVEASHSASIRIQPSKRPLVIGAVAAAVLFLGGMWVFGSDDSPPAAAGVVTPLGSPPGPGLATPNQPPSAASAAVAARPGQSPVAPESVSLVITASPPEAVLYMDGLPLRGNPYTARVRPDGELHLIRATGPGLQSQERVITFDRERVVTFNLSAARGAAPVRASVRPNRRPAAHAAASQADEPAPVPPAEANEIARPAANDVFDVDLRATQKNREIYDEDPYK